MNQSLLSATQSAARFGLLALCLGSQLHAQAPAASVASAQSETAVALTKFEVTGSRIKRLDLEGTQPVLRFSFGEIERSGVSDVSQFLRNLPQNALAYTDEAVFGFTPGAAGANLRGIGVEYTLTLINGRRAAPYAIGAGGTGTFSNTQGIPVGAIQHIDVLIQGASAIYGSDAVAGVINYVLKKDYQGLEVTTTYRNTFDTDISTPGVSITGGVANDKGSAFINVDWQKRNAQFRRDRSWSRSADHSRIGGLNYPILGGTQPIGYPAFIRAVNAQGAASGPVYAASLQPYNTQQLLTNTIGTAAYNNAISDPNVDASVSPETDRYTVMGNFLYHLTPQVSAFLETGFSRFKVFNSVQPLGLDSVNEVVSGVGNLIVPASNPYNPLGVNRTDGGTPTDVRIWYRMRDVGNRTSDVDNQVTRIVTGLKGNISSDWEWQAGIMYMRDAVSNFDGGASIRSRLREAIRGTTAATAYNPFGAFSGAPAGGNQEAVINGFRGLRMQDNSYETWMGDVTTSHSNLFKLPAGEVGLAAGAETRREKISQVRDPASANGDFAGTGGGSNLFGNRRAHSVFAEVRAPLLKRVELSVAGRFEDYSDFGTAVKPQYSLSARATDWLLLRGSYSQGFRAPALIQLFSAQSIAFAGGATVDPLRRNPDNPAQAAVTNSLRLVRGGNPRLDAETSRSYYGGIVVEPNKGLLKGLALSVDWSNIYVYGRIQLPSTAVALRENDPAIVVRNPPSTQDTALGQPGELQELRLTFQNLAKRYTEGLDFGANYRWTHREFGRFGAEWRASWLYKFVTQSARTNPLVENRGSTSLPQWRWNTTLDWRRKAWSASFTTNYVGQNDAFYQTQAKAGTLPTTWIDLGPWVTYDVQVAYDLPWLKTTKVTAGVLNLKDRQPPFYDGAAEGYDPAIANPFGAMYYVRVSKKF